jgi:hypothetical protein
VREVVWLSKADNEDDDDDVASDVDSPEDSVIIGGAKAGLDAFFKNFIFFTLSWKRDDKPGLRLDWLSADDIVNDKNWQQSEGRALEGDVGRYGERRERKRGRKRNERIRNLRRRKRLEVNSKRKLEWGKINNDQQGVPCRDRRYIGARGSALVCASACLSISSQLHGGALFGRQAWGGSICRSRVNVSIVVPCACKYKYTCPSNCR